VIADGPVVCVSHGFQTNYERGFCNGLAAHGVQLTLISSDRSDTPGLAPGIRTLNLRGSQDEDRPAWRKATNLLRYHARLMVCAFSRRRATWHVIGLLAPLVWCGLVEGLWLRLICRRYVLTVHDLLPHGRHTALARRICRWSYRLPHAVVVHTQRMKQELVDDFGLEATKVVVMEHGIEPLHGPLAQAHTPPDEARPMLLVFGIVVPRKGIDLLLQALREWPMPMRLVIAGACPDAAYRRQLQAMLQSHPRRADIEWQDGFVAEAEMERLFRAAALLVLPYRHIDQSGVLFQALRFGVPVLATRVGLFERYITPEVGELAQAGSAAALGSALQRWAARRASFSPARIRAIGQAYEWPRTVMALRGAYLPELRPHAGASPGERG
jgi:glycosyltransferase involved in cell wall biosynthesis